MNTTSNTRRNVRRGAAALMVGGAAAATFSAVPANAATHNWDGVAQCESGGNWSTSTGNGFSGGLQFTPSTWAAFGGQGSPEGASKAEQVKVAENVLAGQGAGAWPNCGKYLTGGTTSGTETASNAAASTQTSADTQSTEQAAPAQQETAQQSTEQAAPAQQQAAPAPKAAEQTAPAATEQAAPAQQQAAPVQQQAPVQYTAPAANGSYTVQAGDTLSSIAVAHGTTWDALASANASTVSNPNLIFPGQVLEIPAA